MKCPKSILLRISEIVILRGAIIKLQAGVCASVPRTSLVLHGTEDPALGAVNFVIIRRIKCDSSGGERRGEES